MLNGLFIRKKEEVLPLSVIPDIHSHLIPGIDDGAQTMEESLAMIRRLVALGYRYLITTPHILWDSYKNTPEIIRDGLDSVRSACAEAGIEVRLEAAAEYFIDEHFVEMLRNGEELLTLPGRRLLVELPYSTPLMNAPETLFSIIGYGYIPVLAHPERYTYFHGNPAVYRKLCEQGCQLQLNALSLTRYYGSQINKVARWLLDEQLITFIGSDAHKLQHTELLGKVMALDEVRKYNFLNPVLNIQAPGQPSK